MRGRRLVGALVMGAVVGIVFAGLSAPADARTPASCVGIDMTSGECKAQRCKKPFAKNLAACAELPSNKSCPVLARQQKRQCDRSCDQTYMKRFPPGFTCDEQ
ncbi:hypothetical protein [Bradyrhizobium sp. AUGA SZCCT0431]|uniref:hypothetical protein n=1 Tax=Bradyrhizobium sp. AUGA SZCCT0431 TaxID=2807674 RepID=UPI001BA46541|nr:hypothetical protein [Bradyrhizobium sp. AUGA SZCCT0431]MBR1147879.1 hypothetical protein [Bradyrhizobium sp. AUGA SZCCT0431]